MLRILLFIGLLVGVDMRAIACSCIGTSTTASALKYTDVVLVGVIRSRMSAAASTILKPNAHIKNGIDTSFHDHVKYIVDVMEVYKGNRREKTVEVFTGLGNGDCGVNFVIGGRYVIYAHRRRLFFGNGSNSLKTRINSFLSTDICTRTTEANEVELAELRKAVSH